MEFLIVVVLIGIWLYGLKIRNDMHKQGRTAVHDPVGLITLWHGRHRGRDDDRRRS